MPAQVLIVHDDVAFLRDAAGALRSAGHEVAEFVDPLAALIALENASSIEVLVTRISFRSGSPNGVSLALVTRHKRPNIQVIFTERAELEEHAKGIGELIPHPVIIDDLVAAVKRALGKSGR